MSLTENEHVIKWVQEMAAMTQPDKSWLTALKSGWRLAEAVATGGS